MCAKAILQPRSLSQFVVVVIFLLAAMVISGYIAVGNLSDAERVLWGTTQFIILFFILVLIWVFITKYR